MISLEEAIWGSETSVENPKKNEGDRVDTNHNKQGVQRGYK